MYTVQGVPRPIGYIVCTLYRDVPRPIGYIVCTLYRVFHFILDTLYVHCPGCSTSYWIHSMYTVQGVPLPIGYIVCILYGCFTSYCIHCMYTVQGVPLPIGYRKYKVLPVFLICISLSYVTFCKIKIFKK